jgi:hypothetical protein
MSALQSLSCGSVDVISYGCIFIVMSGSWRNPMVQHVSSRSTNACEVCKRFEDMQARLAALAWIVGKETYA